MSQRQPRKSRLNNIPMEIDEYPSQSQRSQRASQRHREDVISSQSIANLPDEEEDALAGIVIRYILAADRSKTPLTIANIKKHALPDHTSHYRKVMDKVKNKLRTIFGLTLFDVNSGKLILINNHHNPGLIYADVERSESSESILLFLCLAHIFMAGGSCTSHDLFAFLREIGLPDDNRRHEYFGNISDLINDKFTQQLYLHKSKVSNNEPVLEEFSWGSRAQREIDNAQVLKFVAKVYNRRVQTFPEQYDLVNENDDQDDD